MNTSLAENQRQNQCLELVKLDHDLLLKRIKAGGYSGEYLAAAFLSCYRSRPFNYSLFNTIRLDREGLVLFHGILHMRYVKGWSDDALYSIEQEIKAINPPN